MTSSTLRRSMNAPPKARGIAATVGLLTIFMSILISPGPSSAGGADARRVKAWGDNVNGQIGDTTNDERHLPVRVQDLAGVKQLAPGCDFAVALKRNGTLRSWGENGDSQLGDGNAPNDSPVPVPVLGIDNVQAAAAGADHVLALKENGTVRAWGDNSHGQLGNDDMPNDSQSPVVVEGLANVKAIDAGQYMSYALLENGTVRAWGSNLEGQLGNDDIVTGSDVPVKVKKLDDVKAIATHCEGYHALALKKNGSVWTWGYNSEGEIGDGSLDDAPTPVRVVQMSNVIEIDGGYQHSMALKKNGTVWGWGDNSYGQLGDETNVPKPVPVMVERLSGVKHIAAGEYAGYALKPDGTVRAWGDNSSGQLGDDSTDERRLPVKVKNLLNAVEVAAGTDTAYAITRN